MTSTSVTSSLSHTHFTFSITSWTPIIVFIYALGATLVAVKNQLKQHRATKTHNAQTQKQERERDEGKKRHGVNVEDFKYP